MALPKRFFSTPEERQILNEQVKVRARLHESMRGTVPAPAFANDSLEAALRWSVFNLALDQPLLFAVSAIGWIFFLTRSLFS